MRFFLCRVYTWEICFTWVRYFSFHLDCMPNLKYVCYFHYLCNFLLLFRIQVTSKHQHCLICKKATLSQQSCPEGRARQNCLHGEKSSHLSEISPALRRDLTLVGWIHPQINDLFLESEIHQSTLISVRRDVSLSWYVSPHIKSL